jgi:hypothetical protein
MSVPKIYHPTDRPNFSLVRIADTDYWFSYETCVAVNFYDGRGVFVRQNEWGPTTGRHLNFIDDGAKRTRLTEAQFKLKLEEGPAL